MSGFETTSPNLSLCLSEGRHIDTKGLISGEESAYWVGSSSDDSIGLSSLLCDFNALYAESDNFIFTYRET